jgi:hypothetical protein
LRASLNHPTGTSHDLNPRVVKEELRRAPWLLRESEDMTPDQLFSRTMAWLTRALGFPALSPISEVKITCGDTEPLLAVDNPKPVRTMTAAERRTRTLIERANRLGTVDEKPVTGRDPKDTRSPFQVGVDQEKARIAQDLGRPIGKITMVEAMRGWRERDPEGYTLAERDHRGRFVAGIPKDKSE